MMKKSEFNPCDYTTSDTADWIRNGDFEEAKNVARHLAMFLSVLADNKEAQQAIMKAGVPWIGADIAKLIAEKLRDDPSVNKKAQQELFDLIKAGHPEDAGKLKDVLEKLKHEPNATKGKTQKTGAELFAKVLVPNKPTKQQTQERWLASVSDRNITNTSKNEYQRVAEEINNLVDDNNNIMNEWKCGKLKEKKGYYPSVPKSKVTRDQLEKAHRKYKEEIARVNGITNHRIK